MLSMPRGVDGRQQVFGGGEQHALLHQAGGVADPRDVAAVGLDFKVVQIHAAEDDARTGGRGNQANAARDGGVKANA